MMSSGLRTRRGVVVVVGATVVVDATVVGGSIWWDSVLCSHIAESANLEGKNCSQGCASEFYNFSHKRKLPQRGNH